MLGEEGSIVGCRFCLGNMTFERTRAHICGMLGFADGGVIPFCTVEERSTLMRVISPFDRFITYMFPQNIHDITSKCLHMIASLAINPRLDGGRYISL